MAADQGQKVVDPRGEDLDAAGRPENAPSSEKRKEDYGWDLAVAVAEGAEEVAVVVAVGHFEAAVVMVRSWIEGVALAEAWD